MKKLYFMMICCMLFLPNAFAQHNLHHQRNQPSVALYGNGFSFNFGNQFLYQPYRQQAQMVFIPQPQLVYYAPLPQQQLVRICGSVYVAQTPSGPILQQNCWFEWR